jgi:hypothetical protein
LKKRLAGVPAFSQWFPAWRKIKSVHPHWGRTLVVRGATPIKLFAEIKIPAMMRRDYSQLHSFSVRQISFCLYLGSDNGSHSGSG